MALDITKLPTSGNFYQDLKYKPVTTDQFLLVDASGNPVLDKQGNKITQSTRLNYAPNYSLNGYTGLKQISNPTPVQDYSIEYYGTEGQLHKTNLAGFQERLGYDSNQVQKTLAPKQLSGDAYQNALSSGQSIYVNPSEAPAGYTPTPAPATTTPTATAPAIPTTGNITATNQYGDTITVPASQAQQLLASGWKVNGPAETPASTTNNNRSLISTTPKSGYIKGYDTNNNYAEVYVPKGIYVPGISATPKAVTPGSLSSATGINLPGATGGVDTSGATVAGANTELANLMTQLTPPETETQKKQQSLLDQMASLTGQEAQKAADQLTTEQSMGLPALKSQFAALNSQILTKTAEYNALATKQEGRPITMNSIIGAEAQIQKAKASEIGLLQAQAQGLQGQIETSQNTANRAIDLKYSTIESQLNVYQAQLNALQPLLNKEEKIQAQAQQAIVDAQTAQLNATKTAEKELTGYLLDLMTKYPDAGISLTDSTTSAQAKVSKSKIYQDQVRAPSSGGGGSTASKTTTTDLVNTISSALQSNNAFGEDGKVSWESYLWAYQNWINNGGTKASFDANFPVGQYLDEGNREALNAQLGA